MKRQASSIAEFINFFLSIYRDEFTENLQRRVTYPWLSAKAAHLKCSTRSARSVLECAREAPLSELSIPLSDLQGQLIDHSSYRLDSAKAALHVALQGLQHMESVRYSPA